MQFHESRQALRFPSAIISAIILILVILSAWWLPPDAAHIVMVLPILWATLSAVLQRRGRSLASGASAILAAAAANFAQCLGNYCRGHLA
jgi:hypothetical protein